MNIMRRANGRTLFALVLAILCSAHAQDAGEGKIQAATHTIFPITLETSQAASYGPLSADVPRPLPDAEARRTTAFVQRHLCATARICDLANVTVTGGASVAFRLAGSGAVVRREVGVAFSGVRGRWPVAIEAAVDEDARLGKWVQRWRVNATEPPRELRADVGAGGVECVDGECAPRGPGEARTGRRTARLRVAGLNVWNTNPPAYLWGEAARRGRYGSRARHIRRLLATARADVLALQEVRVEHALSDAPGLPPLSAVAGGALRRVSGLRGAAQLLHVLPHGPWQYVYQPAMWYGGTARREEEGVAILSRLPILASDARALSRNAEDPADGHQRVCLRVRVRTRAGSAVDVYTVHFPLSEEARNRAAAEVLAFVRATSTDVPALLTGDLNAEADERAMRFLVGQAEINGDRGDFEDVFSLFSTAGTLEPDAELTFPSDRPVKRIDYMLWRDAPTQSTTGDGAVLRPATFALFGRDPRKGTEAGAGRGMLEADSPAWPSDHRGLVVDVE